jgi:hypothetical protein
MTIKQYIKQLQLIAKKYPDAELVYSVDEEGNAFDTVDFWPVPGHFDAGEGAFNTDTEGKKVNAVCVN